MRTEVISVRLSPAERESLESYAYRAGQSVGAIVRDALRQATAWPSIQTGDPEAESNNFYANAYSTRYVPSGYVTRDFTEGILYALDNRWENRLIAAFVNAGERIGRRFRRHGGGQDGGDDG